MTPAHRRRPGVIHLRRFGEILSILVGHGFGDFLGQLNYGRYRRVVPPFLKRKPPRYLEENRWDRIRMALEDLGPTFIKLGQFFSNRPDILPKGLIDSLEKLQDATRATEFSTIESHINTSLSKEARGQIATIDPTPLASASIAQVHRAQLLDGSEIALKILKPNLYKAISTDVAILHYLASLIEKRFELFRALNITLLIEEFERTIMREINFRYEAGSIMRFRANFSKNPDIYAPKLYTELCNEKILAMEYINGVKVSHIDKLKQMNIDTTLIAKKGAVAVLDQIFQHGLFHADPHPGNIIITPEGAICFIDFGAMGIIPPTLQNQLSTILYGIVNNDPDRIIKSLSRISKSPIKNRELLEYDLLEFMQQHTPTDLKSMQMREILNDFVQIISKHNIKILPGFFMLLKSLITMEGVGRKLDPSFSITEYVRPQVKKILLKQNSLKTLPFDAYFNLGEILLLLRDLPFESREFIRMAKNGLFKMQFEHRGLEPLLKMLDILVNRMVFAIVLSAIIIGSSLVVLADIPPKIGDVPVIGIAGFSLAALIGFVLLFSILRKNKL